MTGGDTRNAIRRRSAQLAARTAIALCALLLSIAPAWAIDVTNPIDDGLAGSLTFAINDANANPGSTINILVAGIELQASLPPITADTIINGNGVNIDATGFQAFTVSSGTVALNEMVVSGATVVGGAGQEGAGGGGGGLGAGAGLFVDAAANVTITDVTFTSSSTTGGDGGAPNNGLTDGGDGGGLNGATGVAGGAGNGSAGGFGGGGSGSGSSGTMGGTGGFGAGDGGVPGTGGDGGDALGGAVFVSTGGTLTIIGTTIDQTNQVNGGTRGSGTATDGASEGSGIYVMSGVTANIDTTTNTDISANIAGAGGLLINGNGTATLTGTNVYTGGTAVSGTAQLIGNTNSIQGAVTNDSTVTFDQNFDGTYAGNMTGGGVVNLTGTGTITFSGINGYTGGTFVQAGNLIGTTDSLQNDIDVASGSLLSFTQTFTGTYAGTITGGGEVAINGGSVTFTGANNYTGLTTVNTGTLRGTTTTLPGDIVTNSLVVFDQAVNDIFTHLISGSGGVQITGGGMITYGASNSYTGLTTVDGGSTLVAATDSVHGNILNSSAVIFDQAFNGTYAGDISGSGSMTFMGGGNYTLTGTNSYLGGTTVNAGTVTGDTDSLTGDIVNNSTIIFSQAFDGTYAGAITGVGGVDKNGNGTVTLTGISNYGGPTNINVGGVLLNGEITSDLTTVAADARLGGSGTIHADVVNNGTLSNGTAIGEFTIDGNLTLSNGSTVEVKANNAGNTPGTNQDHYVVTGSAALDGTVNILPQGGGVLPGTPYRFLTGSYAGTFDDATVTGAFLQAVLLYEPGGVSFSVTTDYANIAETFNQSGVANYLDDNSLGAAGDFQTVLGQLNSLTVPGVRSALEMMEGEGFGTAAQLNIHQTTYMYMLLRRSAGLSAYDGRVDVSRPSQSAMTAQRDSVSDIRQVSYNQPIGGGSTQPAPQPVPMFTGSVQGFGLGGSASGDGNAAGGTYGLGGSLVTLHRVLDDERAVGAFGGFSSFGLGTQGPVQNVQATDVQLGAYFRNDIGSDYWLGAGSTGIDSYSSQRRITFGTIDRTATANYSGWQSTAYLERGLRTGFGRACMFEPFVALQFTHLYRGGFAETGADSLNLTVKSDNSESFRNLLGMRLAHLHRAGWYQSEPGGNLECELRTIWIHEYLQPVSFISSNFTSVGGTNFYTRGLNYGRDWAMLGGRATWNRTQFTQLFVNYDLMLNSRQTYHAGAGGISIAF